MFSVFSFHVQARTTQSKIQIEISTSYKAWRQVPREDKKNSMKESFIFHTNASCCFSSDKNMFCNLRLIRMLVGFLARIFLNKIRFSNARHFKIKGPLLSKTRWDNYYGSLIQEDAEIHHNREEKQNKRLIFNNWQEFRETYNFLVVLKQVSPRKYMNSNPNELLHPRIILCIP